MPDVVRIASRCDARSDSPPGSFKQVDARDLPERDRWATRYRTGQVFWRPGLAATCRLLAVAVAVSPPEPSVSHESNPQVRSSCDPLSNKRPSGTEAIRRSRAAILQGCRFSWRRRVTEAGSLHGGCRTLHPSVDRCANICLRCCRNFAVPTNCNPESEPKVFAAALKGMAEL